MKIPLLKDFNKVILVFISLSFILILANAQNSPVNPEKTQFLRVQMSQIATSKETLQRVAKVISIQKLTDYLTSDPSMLAQLGIFYVSLPSPSSQPNANLQHEQGQSSIQDPMEVSMANEERPSPNLEDQRKHTVKQMEEKEETDLAEKNLQPTQIQQPNFEKEKLPQELQNENSTQEEEPIQEMKAETPNSISVNTALIENSTELNSVQSKKPEEKAPPIASDSKRVTNSQVKEPSSTPPISNLNNLFSGKRESETSRKITPEIVNRQFTDIGLYHDVPYSFTVGETFRFHGVVTNPSRLYASLLSTLDYNIVTVVFSGYQTNSEFRCKFELPPNTYEFDIDCLIEDEPGKYFLSIFAGKYGESSRKLREIHKLSKYIQYDTVAPLPSGITMQIQNNDVVVKWDTQAAITKLIFSQASSPPMRVQYILTNYHTQFKLPLKDFNNFKQMNTILYVFHANSADESLYLINSEFSKATLYNFQAIPHKFASSKKNLVKVEEIPWRVAVGEKVKIRGSIDLTISSEFFLIAPSLKITKLRLDGSTTRNPPQIRPGTYFSIEFSFSQPGPHIIEINAITGQAVINRPIYVGDGWPIIPDFNDLQIGTTNSLSQDQSALESYISTSVMEKQISEPPASAPIKTQREYLLALTNALRKKYKAESIYLDDSLNQLAQSHADNMKIFNYFSHTDRLGRNPGDRAKAMGILSSVGENIAQASLLSQAHLMLERSASHLENSINPLWTRVGIGISKGYSGMYYVVYEFSSRDLAIDPLTQAEISGYQQELVKISLAANPYLKREEKTISRLLTQWMNTDRRTRVFDYIYGNGVRKSMSATTIQVTYREDWLDKVREESGFLRNYVRYDEVSIGVSMANTEVIEVYFVFS